jgi:thiamine pyrophosphate-dependent acetolactate synthase large subunit-like protein
VARGFGAAGLRLEGLGGLEEALAQPGPAVIDVVTDPNDSGPLR